MYNLPSANSPPYRQERHGRANRAAAPYTARNGVRPRQRQRVWFADQWFAAVSFSAAIIHIRGPSFPLIRPDPIKTPIDDAVSSQPRHTTGIPRVYVAGDTYRR